MTTIPYDSYVKVPVSTMSETNLTNFLNTSKLMKRQQSSSVATLTTDQLIGMCPLNYVGNQDILVGCIAGIVYLCQAASNYAECRRYYVEVFANSIFAPIGANCPAWKSGINSTACTTAVNGFNAVLEYTSVNKYFASLFATTLFANKIWAPCSSQIEKCNW